MEWDNWVVLGKFAQVKGAVRIPKDMFLSYCVNAPLIQLSCSGPLRACTKFEGLSGVVVDKNSFGWRSGYKRGLPWSKRCGVPQGRLVHKDVYEQG